MGCINLLEDVELLIPSDCTVVAEDGKDELLILVRGDTPVRVIIEMRPDLDDEAAAEVACPIHDR